MKRLIVVAASVAVFVVAGAAGALAGEVKGPPGVVNNTNETGALDHANSACAASGLNDLDEAEGQTVSQGRAGAACAGADPGKGDSQGWPRRSVGANRLLMLQP